MVLFIEKRNSSGIVDHQDRRERYQQRRTSHRLGRRDRVEVLENRRVQRHSRNRRLHLQAGHFAQRYVVYFQPRHLPSPANGLPKGCRSRWRCHLQVDLCLYFQKSIRIQEARHFVLDSLLRRMCLQDRKRNNTTTVFASSKVVVTCPMVCLICQPANLDLRSCSHGRIFTR